MTHRLVVPARHVRLAALAAALTATIFMIGTAFGQGPTVSVLNSIRAAHHPSYDRIVFAFSGPIPLQRKVRYVTRLVADPSGRQLPVAGGAILQLRLSSAVAHTTTGAATVSSPIAFALPNVMTVVRAGDFEAVLSFGIGLAQRASFHVWTLTRPSRVVIDVSTPSRVVTKGVFFFDQKRFVANRQPFVTRVARPVSAGTIATALLDRLFAGPTASEASRGLRLVSSRATGFAGLSIVSGVARLRLTGGCASGGSTVSIADEIFTTLKQLRTVQFVKIYDPSGHTEHPTSAGDSIPFCLEP